jgi:hypothetical protein
MSLHLKPNQWHVPTTRAVAPRLLRPWVAPPRGASLWYARRLRWSVDAQCHLADKPPSSVALARLGLQAGKAHRALSPQP